MLMFAEQLVSWKFACSFQSKVDLFIKNLKDCWWGEDSEEAKVVESPHNSGGDHCIRCMSEDGCSPCGCCAFNWCKCIAVWNCDWQGSNCNTVGFGAFNWISDYWGLILLVVYAFRTLPLESLLRDWDRSRQPCQRSWRGILSLLMPTH